MYFVLYFLAGIVLFIFLLYKFLEIIFDKKGYSTTYYRVYAVLLFLVMVATFANILIATYTYRKTINIAGKRGDKGIKGNAGPKGKKGTCDEKCGQKVCYVDIIDAANKHFQDKVNDLLIGDVVTNIKKEDYKIKNGVMLDKINGICKSDQYQSIMLGKHRKKPNEQKLINYLKEIIKEWIDYLIDVTNTGGHQNETSVETKSDSKTILLEEINKGVRFLLEPNWGKNRLDYESNGTKNPFQEIEKYDIWNWGEGLKLKPLEVTIKTTDFERPKPDEARLNIIKSNNYQKVFDTAKPKDLWDDKQCDFDQMVDKNGDKTNPQNLNKCVFLNDSYLKDYINTWKTDVFQNERELSLYNADSYKNERNQEFYPVGSVWRGKESGEKPTGAIMSPKSKNSCGAGHGASGTKKANNQGPEKETILVSGDVKEPTDLTLVWDNKVGCDRCQEGSHDTVKIYRPTAPNGYVCLGDYATTSKLTTKEDIAEHKGRIRCVPKECVREKKIGSYFWNNKHLSHDRYNSYQSYISKTPYETDTQLGASFWTAGIDNVGVAEEQKNLYGQEFEDDEGYNVFRVNKGFKRPKDFKTYVIKEECLMAGGGKEPRHPELNLTKILKDDNAQDAGLGLGAQYDVSEYYKSKPKFAILTNIGVGDGDANINNFEGNPIKLYLLDDLNPTKDKHSDTYFLATFNTEKNDFSNYIVTSATKEIRIVDRVSKNNKYHRWVVKGDMSDDIPYDDTGEYQGGDSNTFSNISIISAAFNADPLQYLHQEYDSNAKSKFKLKSGSSGNWRYDSYLKGKLPKYKINPPSSS